MNGNGNGTKWVSIMQIAFTATAAIFAGGMAWASLSRGIESNSESLVAVEARIEELRRQSAAISENQVRLATQQVNIAEQLDDIEELVVRNGRGD